MVNWKWHFSREILSLPCALVRRMPRLVSKRNGHRWPIMQIPGRGRGRDINRSDWKRLAEFRQTSFNYLEFSVRRRESKEIGSVNYAVKTAKLFFIALVVPLPLLPLFFIVFFLLFFFFFLILLLLFFFLFVVAFFRRTGSRGEPITRSDYRPRALYARLDLRAPN